MEMKQKTFTDIEYSFRKKKTKREEFLEIMDEIIPWDEWVGVIKPIIPRGSVAVRPWGLRKCCGGICCIILFRCCSFLSHKLVTSIHKLT